MRNDVKLGFAIGGVLLAVVIVFALVNSSAPTDPVVEPVTAQGDSDTTTAPMAESTRPTDNSAATNATSVTPDAVSVTPDDAVARSTTTDPWAEALGTGRLPTMMNSQPTQTQSQPAGRTTAATSQDNNSTASTTASTTTDQTTARSSGPAESASSASVEPSRSASSNTPLVLGGGVYERPSTSSSTSSNARVTLPAKPSEPDADRVISTYASTAGKSGSSHSATAIATPAKTVLTARTHTIKSGETFSTIATAYYGHIRHAKLIAKANPGVDSTRLKVGQVINLPAYDPSADAKPAATTIDTRTQYRVQPGDSLYNISMKLYGTPRKVDALYAANRATIGNDRSQLKPGMILTLPAQPTVARK